jgi:hypothetical protein
MSSFPYVKLPGDCSPVMHDRGGGFTVVDVRPDAVNAFANTSERVPDVSAEHPTEITTEIPRVLNVGFWRSLAVLIGFIPDPRLVACELIATRRGLTWRYEHCTQRDRRTARARRELELRVKARELARRVESMKLALAPMLHLETWQVDLAVPVEYDQEGADPVRLAVPDGWAGAKAGVEDVIAERLGGEWTVRWHLATHPHYVTFKRRIVKPKPPKMVEWELSGDRYSIFVGQTGTKKVYVRTETETPHWGVSAGTGGGKTSTLTLPAVHWRGHGGLVDVIDLKQDSYETSLMGVSGFRVHTDVISAVTAMAEFLVSAKSMTVARSQGYPMDTVPPRILLIDEFGSFVSAVDSWWKYGIQEKGTSPVFAWFHMVLMQGRTKNHRVVVGTHDFSRETFKGTGPRDLIGTKILIGAVSNPKWVTTFGYEFKRIEFDAKQPGRGVIGIAGVGVDELQLAYIDPPDVRAVCSEFEPAPAWFDRGEMAPWITEQAIELTHREAHIRPFLPGGEYVTYPDLDPASQGASSTPDQPDQAGTGLRLVLTPEQEAAREAGQLVGLREALDHGYLMALIREANHRNSDAPAARLVELALHVVRKARKEDASFPAAIGQRGQEKLYLVRDLRQWEANRPNAMKLDNPEKASGEDTP